MSIKDQIRAEIERMREINKKAFKAEHIRADEFRGRTLAINHLSAFLYTLPEQPVDIPSAGSGAMGTTPPKFKLEVKEQPVDELEEAADAHIRRVADAAGHPGWDWETQDIAEAFKAGAEWQEKQTPLPEDTTIFLKGVAEGKRLEREEQKPELVHHPAISYMCNADASRGEQYKQALIALLKSDLIQVAGRRFTKTELIEWVETRPAEIKEDEK